jgi:hypothetical protein
MGGISSEHVEGQAVFYECDLIESQYQAMIVIDTSTCTLNTLNWKRPGALPNDNIPERRASQKVRLITGSCQLRDSPAWNVLFNRNCGS